MLVYAVPGLGSKASCVLSRHSEKLNYYFWLPAVCSAFVVTLSPRIRV